MTLLSLLAALVLALCHIFAARLRFLHVIPRSWWLSMGSGVSVAYVFLHLLPELSAGQQAVAREAGQALAFLEHHIYLVAMIGLATFYGLERLAKGTDVRETEEKHRHPVFWIHMVTFVIYNALIGYLLLRLEEFTALTLALYTAAMGFHFVINDVGLREDYEAAYHRLGRWILAGAVVIGWAVGYRTEISEVAISILTAFLAGAIILNILKEELPKERESRFSAFALGATGYAALLLMV